MTSKTDVPGVALISGSGSGIGRATALAFAQAGCTRLALLDLNEEGLLTTKELIEEAVGSNTSLKVHVFQCDVSNPDSVTRAYTGAKETFSRLDYAVHCAGVIFFGRSTDFSLEDFDKQNNVNYRGLWLCSREALRIMRSQSLDCDAYPEAQIPPTRAQRGSIVNISSGLALVSQSNCPAYSGAKAGALAVSRSDGIDYASERIRVNAVLPGIVDSPMTNPDPETRKWLEANPVQSTPMRRFGLPEEIADVCVFLAGNKASFVTGAGWCVDGGFIAGMAY
ncbi:uncharacterized protein Z519_10627 [Cladophialophora bantiana CBS 173.52]|uniref:3-oxoacyl-[acyl-carrier protein] reductase n=1 Tax=Cladophialophora bantiana (strain ATCC 10958 / CBS 173.52 / CDC B-1940 / NIH 8579) TaxID=1442370 RepID=A0A0D2EEU1_CLAB1|nr:uncharacterized protein Z519_10627 [Cladophialophora bantiana CBS 173.52]KIW88581.1 hypothetical protein Z519_10627 [Cladophialophora bantiana CBS 173.52]